MKLLLFVQPINYIYNYIKNNSFLGSQITEQTKFISHIINHFGVQNTTKKDCIWG